MRSFTTLFLALSLLVPLGRQAAAQLGEPIFVVNVASVDRVLEDVHWVFDSVDRADLAQGVDTALNAVNNLKGMDRSKPFGAMGFLAPTGAGAPLVVGYVPVTDLDELMGSLTIGPLRPQRVESDDPNAPTRWRIAGPEQPGQAVFIEARGGYAWIANDPELLSTDFPDPTKVAGPLTERYDIGASVNLAGVPQALRFLASAGLRAARDGGVPREPNETDAQYRAKQLGFEAVLDAAEQFVNGGRDVSWGLEFSKKRKDIRFEVAANAVEDSKLSESFAAFRGTPSRFAGSFEKGQPFLFSTAWKAPESLRELLTLGLEEGRKEALAEAKNDPNAPPPVTIETIFDVLDATAEEGNVDVAVQMKGTPPGRFVVLGTIGVKDGNKLKAIGDELLKSISTEPGTTVTRNALEHGGMTFHRFETNAPDDEARRLFGSKPVGFIGANDRGVWIAFGGPTTEATLKSAVDAAERDVPRADDAPVFLVDAGAATMILLADERDPDFEAVAQKAFLGGGDRIKVALGPKQDGVAFNVTLGEGWVRLLGLGIARGVEQNR